MCRVNNLTSTSQDFDSWFANLKTDDIQQQIPEFNGETNFDELLAPLAIFESSYTPEIIEPIKFEQNYPSPPPSYLIPPPTLKRANDEDDEVMKKRQRQNEAAKRCRQKKLSLIQQSKDISKKFEEDMFQMSVKLAVLQKEKQAWMMKETDMQHQLATLKQQLDESHMILMNLKSA
jgi:hypothetical protein